jgi:RHS repeat-associated protein
VTTTSAWDIAGGLPVELYDGGPNYVGARPERSRGGIGRVSEVADDGATYYYLPDALGSTMALCDASGNIVNSHEYDAFGAVRSSSGSTANAFTYTGERTDASTGLEYPSASSGRALCARYYDTATGAFISRDPVANPNRYAYADGDPIMLTDPPGLCASDKSVAELRAKLDKLESRLGTGKLAEYWRAERHAGPDQ